MRVVLAARPLSWPLALAAGHQEPEAASFCKNLVAQGQCGKRGRFSGFWRLSAPPVQKGGEILALDANIIWGRATSTGPPGRPSFPLLQSGLQVQRGEAPG